MKQSRGKIFFLLICSLFFPLIAFAKVSLQAPTSFYQGDSVEFSISASGKDIKIPQIDTIEGFVVQSLGTSTQTNIINGARTDKYIKNYAFKPTKDITIPAFKIEINGKIETTKPFEIKMQKVEKTVSNEYDLTLSIDKKEVFVGEPIHLVLLFKYKKDLNIVGLEFEKPNFENFWTKELKANENLPQDTEFNYQKLEYLLFAQKSGTLSISPLKIESVTAQDRYSSSFFVTSPTQRTKIYSNPLQIDVKPLPKDINLVGDFSIEATIDKDSIKQGEAVSYKVTIEGRGNIDDIKEIKLDLKDATVYENPSKIKEDIKEKLYGGTYTKAFSIVPTKSFTIPEISLEFFDKETQKVKTVKTKSFDIAVEMQKVQETKLEVSKEKTQAIEVQQSNDSVQTTPISQNEKILYFIFGVLVGGSIVVVVYTFIQRKKGVRKDDTPLMREVKNAKTQEELLKTLVVYIKIDENLDKIIFALESKVEPQEFKKLKKELVEILKSLDIKGFKSDTKVL
jgi:hypothetical protein